MMVFWLALIIYVFIISGYGQELYDYLVESLIDIATPNTMIFGIYGLILVTFKLIFPFTLFIYLFIGH